MNPGFQTHRGLVAPIPFKNVDTDQIIPARFLTGSRGDGFSRFLFYDLRHDETGASKPGFVLDEPSFATASILASDENFGCGSSREQAVWALVDAGYKAVIAPSFGEIFFINSMKNGLLPIIATPDQMAALLREGANRPQELEIDLIAQTVIGGGTVRFNFEIDPYWKNHLVDGTTELGLTLSLIDEIRAFQTSHRASMDWAFSRPEQRGEDRKSTTHE